VQFVLRQWGIAERHAARWR